MSIEEILMDSQFTVVHSIHFVHISETSFPTLVKNFNCRKVKGPFLERKGVYLQLGKVSAILG